MRRSLTWFLHSSHLLLEPDTLARRSSRSSLEPAAVRSSGGTAPGILSTHPECLLLSLVSVVPPNISELKNLEVLNMFNNQIEDLPTQISSLQKLKHLNLG